MFATTGLNRARQSADLAHLDRAVLQLRAAEGAIAQAEVFVDGVDRLASALAAAAQALPEALDEAEAAVVEARERLAEGTSEEVPVGALEGHVSRARAALAAVREEAAAGPYDPLEALHRVAVVSAPLGTVPGAVRLVARRATDAADGFVGTHRGAVGAEARPGWPRPAGCWTGTPRRPTPSRGRPANWPSGTSARTAIRTAGGPSTRTGSPERCSAGSCSAICRTRRPRR